MHLTIVCRSPLVVTVSSFFGDSDWNAFSCLYCNTNEIQEIYFIFFISLNKISGFPAIFRRNPGFQDSSGFLT